MTKQGTGLLCGLSGSLLIMIGLLLTLTVFGAVCGIPMILAGFPLAIFGGIRFRQYQVESLKEGIRQGIVEGAQNRGPAKWCTACGTQSTEVAQFCERCGARMS
jgi:hypothetical protein